MAAPVGVGDVLADKYEVTRILGTGGMGVVVAARHRELDKLVALKFMHEELSSSTQAVERFLREARAAARLQNEHVGRVLDVGRLPGGIPYIVMEYLEGKDLLQVLEERGPLPVSEVVELVLQACEGMAEAHTQGIVHRDLKPQNLFLTTRPDGRRLVKVLDFGISKSQFAKGPTSTAQSMGSPAYMAPEQVKSARSVDARADIWSLGVILYQLLSNRLPFDGDNVHEVMFKVLSEAPVPLASVRSDLPPRVLAAVERCLDKERERRFASVAELAQELVPFAPERARAALSLIERVVDATTGQRPVTSAEEDDPASVLPPTGTAEVTSTTLGGAVSSMTTTAPRAAWPRWVIAIGGAAVVLGLVAFVVTRDRGAGAPSAAPVRGVDLGSLGADAGAVVSVTLDAGTADDLAHAVHVDAAAIGVRPADGADDPSIGQTSRPSRPSRPATRDAGSRPDAARVVAPPPIDAPALEPAREDPVLTPAREP